MKKEIILIPEIFKRDQLKLLQEVTPESEFIITNKNEVNDEMLEKATIIFGNLPPEKVAKAKNLKWMQTNSAGVDSYCKEGILGENVILTNATGAYGLPIGEHM